MTFMKGLPLLLLVASLCSHAALQPDRTRIVFNANDKATSLRVDNRSDKLPYLAYSWLENEKGEKSDDVNDLARRRRRRAEEITAYVQYGR